MSASAPEDGLSLPGLLLRVDGAGVKGARVRRVCVVLGPTPLAGDGEGEVAGGVLPPVHDQDEELVRGGVKDKGLIGGV